MLSVMSDEGNSSLDLPDDLVACHELMRQLRRQNQELLEKLATYEENERQVFRRIYGPGATPESDKTLLC